MTPFYKVWAQFIDFAGMLSFPLKDALQRPVGLRLDQQNILAQKEYVDILSGCQLEVIL